MLELLNIVSEHPELGGGLRLHVLGRRVHSLVAAPGPRRLPARQCSPRPPDACSMPADVARLFSWLRHSRHSCHCCHPLLARCQLIRCPADAHPPAASAHRTPAPGPCAPFLAPSPAPSFLSFLSFLSPSPLVTSDIPRSPRTSTLSECKPCSLSFLSFPSFRHRVLRCCNTSRRPSFLSCHFYKSVVGIRVVLLWSQL